MDTLTLSINPQQLSHELRTPLSNILNLTEMLLMQQHAGANENCHYLNEILAQGQRLLKACNELLFSQYRAAFVKNNKSSSDATVDSGQKDTVDENLPVLVADDEMLVRIFTSTILKEAGYVVDVAEDGYQALKLYQNKRYAALITDINMPLSGIALATEIRLLENSEHGMPIIALTADMTDGMREAYLAAGITEVLTKPTNGKQLLEVLQRHLIG